MTDGYLNMDLAAAQLGFDAGKPFSAMGWAKARVQALLVLQNRAGHDGNIYQTGDWIASLGARTKSSSRAMPRPGCNGG